MEEIIFANHINKSYTYIEKEYKEKNIKKRIYRKKIYRKTIYSKKHLAL